MSLLLSMLAASQPAGSGDYPLPSATEASPWSPTALCQIHDSYGEGAPGSGLVATIHPSVVDLGRPLGGYRWWMANTPYPGQQDAMENPCIYASNDRINWYPPAGLTNPIEPWPGAGWNADTDLVWDPDAGRLVCIWLYGDSAFAKWSTDGVHWSAKVTLTTVREDPWFRSPAIVRVGAGDWRLYQMSTTGGAGMLIYRAPSPLGPWSVWQVTTGGGSPDHADVLRYSDDLWLAIARATTGGGYTGRSADGIAWTWGGLWPSGGAVLPTPYRPTLTPSTKAGWIDVWYSGYSASLPGGCGTAYTRLPVSSFTS